MVQQNQTTQGGANKQETAAPPRPACAALNETIARVLLVCGKGGKSLPEDLHSAPAPQSVVCWVCLEGNEREGGGNLLCGCACRGSAGWAHMGCLVESKGHASSALVTERLANATTTQFARRHDLLGGTDEPWHACVTCKQHYRGEVCLGLGCGWWELMNANKITRVGPAASSFAAEFHRFAPPGPDDGHTGHDAGLDELQKFTSMIADIETADIDTVSTFRLWRGLIAVKERLIAAEYLVKSLISVRAFELALGSRGAAVGAPVSDPWVR